MAKISVIIPVYNVEQYLAKCLDSVFAQTLQDFEVIIVNDGSPDNSQAIIDQYLQQYPDKIIAIKQENAGLAAARNTGIAAATGEYIFFLDSDDYLHPEAFSHSYTHALQHALDIVCFRYFQDTDGVITQNSHRVCHSEDPVKAYILNETCAWNKLYRRDLFVQSGLRFAVGLYYEDLEMIPRLALYTDRIGFLEESLYYYVIRTGSIMRQKKYNPKFASIYTVANTLLEGFGNTPYRQELEYLYIEHLLHGGVLRYLHYPEGIADIHKIAGIMKDTFPRWQQNPYYRALGIKYKIVCNLAYYKQIRLLKFLLGVH